MDPKSFDELSKSLATSVSRRHAIRIIGTTAATGVAALFGARSGFANHNHPCRDAGSTCRSNAECCTGVCRDFHCACAPGTVLCQGECVPACVPPRVFAMQTCTCECP